MKISRLSITWLTVTFEIGIEVQIKCFYACTITKTLLWYWKHTERNVMIVKYIFQRLVRFRPARNSITSQSHVRNSWKILLQSRAESVLAFLEPNTIFIILHQFGPYIHLASFLADTLPVYWNGYLRCSKDKSKYFLPNPILRCFIMKGIMSLRSFPY